MGEDGLELEITSAVRVAAAVVVWEEHRQGPPGQPEWLLGARKTGDWAGARWVKGLEPLRWCVS